VPVGYQLEPTNADGVANGYSPAIQKGKVIHVPRDGDNTTSNDTADFDSVSAMAERLGLEGKERADYIDEHMDGLGYDKVQSSTSYAVRPKEGEEEEGSKSRRKYGIPRTGSSSSGGGRRRGDDYE
jgi:hypothetical protein